jgi:hypothetical protein
MICGLCLKDIVDGEATVVVDDSVRHEECSKEFEQMLGDLEKIYDDTCPKDI